MWKSIRINTQTKTITETPLKEEYRMLGGRSLVAQVLTDEVDPTCDALGADNKLIIALPLLAGTKIGATHRLSFGGKSPMTGGVKESNVGGTAGYFLARHGIKLVIVEGEPEDGAFSNILIKADGTISFEDASEDVGKGTYEVCEKYLDQYGSGNVSIATIGGSGERYYKNSGVCVSELKSGHPCRIAARGGMGAVMGKRGIKAFIIEKPTTRFELDIAGDKEEFDKKVMELNKIMASFGKASAVAQIGTIANVAGQNPLGIMPSYNFSGEYYKEADKIGPAEFLKNLASRGGKNDLACQVGCPCRCSNLYNDENGEHLTSGLEYETVALCGSNLGISDLDAIAKMDRMCDDFGLDTIDMGAALGICMEMGKLEWGDIDGAIGLLQEVVDGTEFGNILGQGAQVTGDYLGCKRIPTVKKQAMAAYDPRNTKGTGITYAISPMGADHTAGVCVGNRYDGSAKPVQMYLTKTMQTQATFADSCMCLFAYLFSATKALPQLFAVFSLLYGVRFDMDRVVEIIAQNIKLEKEFNAAAGMTKEDDKLPDFFYTEESPYTGATFDFSYEEMATVHNFL